MTPLTKPFKLWNRCKLRNHLIDSRLENRLRAAFRDHGGGWLFIHFRHFMKNTFGEIG